MGYINFEDEMRKAFRICKLKSYKNAYLIKKNLKENLQI